ncbi:MAG TPA: Fic family protein [Acidimicrobiales bacterium]|nr:Fic family protein [Acidimicrobiales bacterium]
MIGDVTIDWQGYPVLASVPPAIRDLELQLPEAVVRATERAVAAIERSNDHLPPSFEPIARLLLRFEGVASSAFEQIRAPLEEIAAAEITTLMTGPSAWVADNLAVVSAAVDSARREPLTVASLLEWHRRLMEHATNQLDQGLIGAFRDRPVWVGGGTPRDAAYVAPPHELVGALMEDLIDFANADTTDVVTQAAILHAQFESIHPFGDGNGRLGRVLIGWLLVRRLGVLVPPPFSVFVARDPGGYLSGLALYRMGELTQWVRWFATTLERSASSATSLIADVERLTADWRQRASAATTGTSRAVRVGATFWGVLEMLPEHPIVSAQLVQERFRITNEAARQVLHRLQSFGILSPIELRSGTPGRPVRWWAAHELIDVIGRSS